VVGFQSIFSVSGTDVMHGRLHFTDQQDTKETAGVIDLMRFVSYISDLMEREHGNWFWHIVLLLIASKG
jgi:hypothetical protein